MAVTWNPADKSAGITLSNSDLTATRSSADGWAYARATTSKSSGKWYFEVKLSGIPTTDPLAFVIGVEIGSTTPTTNPIAHTTGAGWAIYVYSTGINKRYANSNILIATQTLANNDIIQISLDLDNSKIWLGRNNTWYNSGNPATGTNPAYTGVTGVLFPALSLYYAANESLNAQFLSSSQTYAPPSGFSAWDDGQVITESPRFISVFPLHNSHTISQLGL